MRDRFVDVRGLRLHVRERGEGDPVLLLHGWLDQCGSFDRLAPLLEGRTLALDWRGHGDSSWVGAGGFYHFLEYVADLAGVLDALELSRVRLVGHSLGGAVALLACAAMPERISHATLLDAWPMSVQPSEVPDRLEAYLADLRGPRVRRVVPSVEFAAERLRKVNPLLPLDVALHLAQGGTSPDANGQLAWKWDPWLRAHSPLPVTKAVLDELLARVRTPLLLLRAGTTWLPEEAELRAHLPNAPVHVVTIDGTSHHLHLEAPQRVAAEIRGHVPN